MVKQPPKQCHEFSATPEKKTVRDIKEKHFSVALAFDAEMQRCRDAEVQRCRRLDYPPKLIVRTSS
jgi:hypothetical protein